MNQFKNVTLTKEANVYFDGKVTSRTITFANGEVKTLGIMNPGEYEFATQKAEIMEILAGDFEILLPNETKWQSLSAPTSFNVDANSSFKITAKTLVDYCCSYID